MKIVLGSIAIGLILIAAITGMWLLSSYNSMVSGNESITNAWAQVETQYQRRFDLIPNLVNATKGVLKQEQKVFGDIANARTHYANAAPNSTDKVQATQQYEGALARLLVVIENYPELKSYASVTALTDELAGTENRVLIARDRYNDQVKNWNVSIKSFPRNILAGMFGFSTKEFFNADEAAKTAPTVNLE
jgi:LemA protein